MTYKKLAQPGIEPCPSDKSDEGTTTPSRLGSRWLINKVSDRTLIVAIIKSYCKLNRPSMPIQRVYDLNVERFRACSILKGVLLKAAPQERRESK